MALSLMTGSNDDRLLADIEKLVKAKLKVEDLAVEAVAPGHRREASGEPRGERGDRPRRPRDERPRDDDDRPARTPRGAAKHTGALHSVTPMELLAGVLRELTQRTGVDTGMVADGVFGCVTQTGEQGGNIGKSACLLADWLRVRRVSPLPSRLVIADGLELGFISGWHALQPADGDGRRSRGAAWVELQAPPSATVLQLDLAGGRPDGSATALRIVVNGRVLFDAVVPAVRQQLTLPLPADLQGRALLVELRSSAYLPRDFDRSSPDGRKLGVQLFSIEVR
jgi:hypothetical protein